MRRRMAPLATVVLLAALLAGCAAPTGSGSSALATYPRPEAGMDALLEGTLIISDRCVWVRSQGMRNVPVFPEGDAEVRDGVLIWRGTEYADGDSISLGGGYLPDGGTIPAGCGLEPDALFFVSPY
ncbi:hypothetical protein [Microbacterium invictum]|uniref:Lipoprotein n=1 Tax=Microbacterium invictum TaxID=515415 RepID=A0AA40SQ02_9MICO|nr:MULTISPECIES: hypothetical protein [Microbacterium]MBB4140290.1 hypothetical protein [Microbacterium invictum]